MNKLMFTLTLISFFIFTCCSKKKDAVFRIGSTTAAVDLLNNLKSDFKKAGINVEIVEFSDYKSPNLALARKKIDMNFFQHKPFLDDFKEKNNLKLTALDSILISPIGIYSKKVKHLKDLKEGSTIGLPNDSSNLTRSLLVLQDSGLIKLDPNNISHANTKDIIENKKNLKFREEPASKLPDLLDDLDATFINGNFIVSHKIDITKTLIYKEKTNSPYANVIVVRTEDKDDEIVKRVIEVIKSNKTKKYLKDKFGERVIPTF